MGMFAFVKKMIRRATMYQRFGYEDSEAYLRDMADIHNMPYKVFRRRIALLDPDTHCTDEFHKELERIADKYHNGKDMTLDEIADALANTH